MKRSSLSETSATATGDNKKYSNEIEETITRIRSHKGVEGIMVLSQEGTYILCSHTHLKEIKIIYFFKNERNIGWTIYSTFDEEQTATHSALISQLTSKASHVVDALDTNDELTFLRIRSRHREIMVCEIYDIFEFHKELIPFSMSLLHRLRLIKIIYS